MLLENPYTGLRTEPVAGIASEPGQIGYNAYWWAPGYYGITGFGGDSIIVELSNREELENKVIVNCIIVQQAIEEFALLNSGVYPCNVGVDTTPWGETLIDFLPDGMLLENPITRVATEPVDGYAVTSGSTGYCPYQNQLGINVGYRIVGGGVTGEEIIVLIKEPTL
jgi:hypothetical protein